MQRVAQERNKPPSASIECGKRQCAAILSMWPSSQRADHPAYTFVNANDTPPPGRALPEESHACKLASTPVPQSHACLQLLLNSACEVSPDSMPRTRICPALVIDLTSPTLESPVLRECVAANANRSHHAPSAAMLVPDTADTSRYQAAALQGCIYPGIGTTGCVMDSGGNRGVRDLAGSGSSQRSGPSWALAPKQLTLCSGIAEVTSPCCDLRNTRPLPHRRNAYRPIPYAAEPVQTHQTNSALCVPSGYASPMAIQRNNGCFSGCLAPPDLARVSNMNASQPTDCDPGHHLPSDSMYTRERNASLFGECLRSGSVPADSTCTSGRNVPLSEEFVAAPGAVPADSTCTLTPDGRSASYDGHASIILPANSTLPRMFSLWNDRHDGSTDHALESLWGEGPFGEDGAVAHVQLQHEYLDSTVPDRKRATEASVQSAKLIMDKCATASHASLTLTTPISSACMPSPNEECFDAHIQLPIAESPELTDVYGTVNFEKNDMSACVQLSPSKVSQYVPGHDREHAHKSNVQEDVHTESPHESAQFATPLFSTGDAPEFQHTRMSATGCLETDVSLGTGMPSARIDLHCNPAAPKKGDTVLAAVRETQNATGKPSGSAEIHTTLHAVSFANRKPSSPPPDDATQALSSASGSLTPQTSSQFGPLFCSTSGTEAWIAPCVSTPPPASVQAGGPNAVCNQTSIPKWAETADDVANAGLHAALASSQLSCRAFFRQEEAFRYADSLDSAARSAASQAALECPPRQTLVPEAVAAMHNAEQCTGELAGMVVGNHFKNLSETTEAVSCSTLSLLATHQKCAGDGAGMQAAEQPNPLKRCAQDMSPEVVPAGVAHTEAEELHSKRPCVQAPTPASAERAVRKLELAARLAMVPYASALQSGAFLKNEIFPSAANVAFFRFCSDLGAPCAAPQHTALPCRYYNRQSPPWILFM